MELVDHAFEAGEHENSFVEPHEPTDAFEDEDDLEDLFEFASKKRHDSFEVEDLFVTEVEVEQHLFGEHADLFAGGEHGARGARGDQQDGPLHRPGGGWLQLDAAVPEGWGGLERGGRGKGEACQTDRERAWGGWGLLGVWGLRCGFLVGCLHTYGV